MIGLAGWKVSSWIHWSLLSGCGMLRTHARSAMGGWGVKEAAKEYGVCLNTQCDRCMRCKPRSTALSQNGVVHNSKCIMAPTPTPPPPPRSDASWGGWGVGLEP